MALLVLCIPGNGQSQDTHQKTGSPTVFVFSQGGFVSANGTHYRSITEDVDTVIAPVTSRDSAQDIRLSPDCTAKHPSLGVATFGSTPSGFAIRFENGLDLDFPDVKVDWKAMWPKLAHCTLD